MTKRIGVAALARSTFDVPFAEENARACFAALAAAGLEVVGPRTLLFDADAAKGALEGLTRENLDALLLLQVTFTDATMTVAFADAVKAPLAIWAIPEPRAGGRLRLNSFCGLNLAGHALGRAGKAYSYLFASPTSAGIGAALRELVAGQRRAEGRPVRAARDMSPEAEAAAARVEGDLRGRSIGLVGRHPDGFDTCRYEPETLKSLAGVGVETIELGEVFARAKAAPEGRVAEHRRAVADLKGIDEVDQPQLDRSMRVYDALDGLASDRTLAAMAVRCWPEMFTEYGCAACGPMALLNGQKVPAACEADVYGALTALALQEIAGASSWLVDIVDLDPGANTGVFWHCGSAPRDMCDEAFQPEAQIHTNRRMPLLQQFPLKPGRITIARVSQSRNAPKMVIAGGEVVRAPMAFTGTSAVVKFDAGADGMLKALCGDALEHHVAIAYGDHRAGLEALARRWKLPVLEIA
jgi:L-fucose isomerase-like protein